MGNARRFGLICTLCLLAACKAANDPGESGSNGNGPRAQRVALVPIIENYGIHDTFVRDGLAFVFAWNDGLHIFDVGNGIDGGRPDNPVEVSHLQQLGGETHNGWWFHNPTNGEKKYLFVGQEGPGVVGASSSGSIFIVDVSDLHAPTQVAVFDITGAGPHNFWMDEDAQILYAAYYNEGVIAVDVSGTLTGNLATQGRILAQVKPGGANNTYIWGVQLYNGSLYASDMVSGFWQLSAANLSTKGGGNNSVDRYLSDLWMANGYGYTGTWGLRAQQGNVVKIWHLDPNGAPLITDSIKVAGIATVSDIEVSPNGKVLMFSSEGGPNQGVYFYSLANPAKPRLISRSLVGPPSGGVHTATFGTIAGRTYLFGARDPSGSALMIWDVTQIVN